MKTNSILDISPLISENLGVFPGDVKFQRAVSLDFKKGDHLLLSSIQTTLHLGAHADGPNHYQPGAAGIGSRDLSIYLGRCRVLTARAPRGERIRRAHLQVGADWGAPRILIASGSFPDPNHWNSDFNSLHPELIEEMATAGVQLVGIDTPSIDPEQAKVLESHQMVARYSLAILEGLVLDQVAEGFYTLIALPIKIHEGDAAPVRAVLIPDLSLLT